MIIGPFLRIEFISTSISWSDADSSSLWLSFLAALLSCDFEDPVLPTRATPSWSSELGFTTTLPPLLPSVGVILRPAAGLPSAPAAGASEARLAVGTFSTMGFCLFATIAWSCSSWIRATRSARVFSSAMTDSRASLSRRAWIAATVRV
jgi:hypothetical protein